MLQLKFRKYCVALLILVTGAINIAHGDDKGKTESSNEECCEFNSKLKLHELCADKVNAHCANLDQVSATAACLTKVCSDLVCTKNINVSGQFSATEIATRKLCAGTISSTNIYSNGDFYGNDFHTKYRATAVFGADTVYTLGTTLNFDTVLDDPNGNISFGPTQYTAPKSGYYIVTLQVDQFNLVTPQPILGLPVANMTIAVNGVTQREVYTPYLSFLNKQKTTTSALISLNAGDKVSFVYDLLAMDQTSGVVQIPGTVVVEGNGLGSNKSIFKIHYLSSNGPFPTPPTCTPTPVDCSNCVCEPCCTPSVCTDSNGK